MAKESPDLMVAVQGFYGDHHGEPVFVNPGTLVLRGSDLARAFPGMFAELRLIVDTPDLEPCIASVIIVGNRQGGGFGWAKLAVPAELAEPQRDTGDDSAVDDWVVRDDGAISYRPRQ
jgi:hypothetical protein